VVEGADADTVDLGLWAGDDLAATASLGGGAGLDEGLPESNRFRIGVVRVLRRTRAERKGKRDPKRAAIFFLLPVPPPQAQNARRVPTLDDGQAPVTGRLWFVGAMPASGHYVDQAFEDNETVFRYVTDELQLGSVPAILFDPRPLALEARYYPAGLSNPDDYESLSLGDEALTIDRVCDVIRSIHESLLISPRLQRGAWKIWHDPKRLHPRRNAEIVIQEYLRIGLTAALPAFEVRSEEYMAEGRLDIEIGLRDAIDRSLIVRFVLLELKVLRSFTETGDPVSSAAVEGHMLEGIEQAAVYRDSRGTRHAALCCFDMRVKDLGEASFDQVKEPARSLQVSLRRWYLHSSALSLRKARSAALPRC
jgi:hypothetical protein